MAAQSQPVYLSSLQVFRGLAALGVVIYHACLFTDRKTGMVLFGGGYHFGELGVDFFFVLSGFIILLVHGEELGRPECARRYLWRRFFRVYPLLFILTSVKLAYEMVSSEQGRLSLPEMNRVLCSYLLLPIPGGELPIITAAWTLMHEALFYGLFLLALVWGRKVGLGILIVWMSAIVVADATNADLDGMARLICDAHNVEFAFGAAACLVCQKGSGMPLWTWGVGFASLLTGAVIYDSALGMDQPLSVRVLLGFGFALMIVCVGLWERKACRAIWPSWLLWVGDASYSIYLGHSLIVFALVDLGSQAIAGGLVTRYAVAMGSSLAAVLACGLLWLWVERPLLRWSRSRGG